ncbi:MAG TPA: hypothetical protein VF092_07025, partial [Longimicrobium sp.]
FIREQISNSRFRDLYDLKSMSFHAETKFSREVFGLLMLDLWLNEYAVTPPRSSAGHAAGSRAEVALAAE